MKLLVESSEGRLAPLTGGERFVSVSSSHMSQFCRSVGAGCKTDEENLLAINKTLSLESLMLEFKDMAFQTAVTAGWNWHCISSAVEVSVPWLPDFLQGSLNSSNHIAGVSFMVLFLQNLCIIFFFEMQANFGSTAKCHTG